MSDGHGPTRRALVYGDVNLNIIDGSAIWVEGIVTALAGAGVRVDLVLKSPVLTARLVDPLTNLPGVRVLRPFEDALVPGLSGGGMSVAQAAGLLRSLDSAGAPYDMVVVRGLNLVRRLVTKSIAHGRLWTYLTDVPQAVLEATPEAVAELEQIAKASRFLLCQTEELRGFLEGLVTAANGRCVLFPPVVPAVPTVGRAQEDGALGSTERPLRLVYTGKFAPLWNTLEMTALPQRLAAEGIAAELHMIGDKIHNDPLAPDYPDRMREALAAPGVTWHGGLPRAEAMRIAATADVGLGWRRRRLDDSLELSTKVLEYGALGVPAVLNRTPMHERILGADYPLFVDFSTPVEAAIATLVTDPDAASAATARLGAAAERHSMRSAVRRVGHLLERAFPARPAGLAASRRPLRVVVAGHDLKFFTGIEEHLRSLPGIELRIDLWEHLSGQDLDRSLELRDWADVVICEWCGPNAIWYSANKRPDQRLIVRLHRFELYAPYVANVTIDAVDSVVCVSRHYADLTRELTGWPAEKIVVIPNFVDLDQFDRPKLPSAAYSLGFIGLAPARKRLDRALDVLERLRRLDGRFHLFVKSRMPWDYPWIWHEHDERAYTDDILRRVRGTALLRDAVVFDRFGPDVPAWLRGIGWMLSTSEDESFHLAPAEGMASGAVPAVLDWPGSATIYPDRWIHAGVDAMAARIAEVTATQSWDTERQEAQAWVRAAYDLPVVCAAWTALVLGDMVDVAGGAEPVAAGGMRRPTGDA